MKPFKSADAILRGRPADRAWVVVVLCGVAYGAVMGGYGGVRWESWRQVAYSAIKVPALLLFTTALGLPSYFVMNTLMGLRADFGRAMRAVLASQAGLAVILASLAPLTAFWYLSVADYHSAILFNALMFACAGLGAQVLLRRGYRPLIAKDRRHALLLRGWFLIYGFVGIQLGWTLRPFVGAPGQDATFFRSGELENAYVVVVRLIAMVIRRAGLLG